MTATSPKVRWCVAALASAVATLACPKPAYAEPGAEAAGRAQPNLVIVTTDDQSLLTFRRRYMPKTFRFFGRRGTVFTRAVATPPLCCPARAGILTGQYPHNHGVFANDPGYKDLVDKRNVLPAWLGASGYETALVGKPLNLYTKFAESDPGPGFDYWAGIHGPPNYYDYELSVNGEVRGFGHEHDQYLTTKLTEKALGFTKRASRGRDPFFLWLSYFGPHIEKTRSRGGPKPCRNGFAIPPTGDAFRRVADEPLPRGPAFNERDVSDKPRYIRRRDRLDDGQIARVKRAYRCALGTLPAIDAGVGKLVNRLRRLGELDDTIVVVLSDNGWFYGEHRLTQGKGQFYEPAARVPFVARVPGKWRDGPRQRRIGALAATVDIAPTLLDYARAQPCVGPARCRELDGRSLRRLLDGRAGGWRDGRGLLLEIEQGCTAYDAIRTKRWILADPVGVGGSDCRDRSLELYDLEDDPHQLRNLGRDRGGPGVDRARRRLRARLDALRDCSGTADADACE